MCPYQRLCKLCVYHRKVNIAYKKGQHMREIEKECEKSMFDNT